MNENLAEYNRIQGEIDELQAEAIKADDRCTAIDNDNAALQRELDNTMQGRGKYLEDAALSGNDQALTEFDYGVEKVRQKIQTNLDMMQALKNKLDEYKEKLSKLHGEKRPFYFAYWRDASNDKLAALAKHSTLLREAFSAWSVIRGGSWPGEFLKDLPRLLGIERLQQVETGELPMRFDENSIQYPMRFLEKPIVKSKEEIEQEATKRANAKKRIREIDELINPLVIEYDALMEKYRNARQGSSVPSQIYELESQIRKLKNERELLRIDNKSKDDEV